MTMLAVANCACCGKVFQRNLRNMCLDCTNAFNDEYDRCYRYMQQYRKATTEQLRQATGVSVKRIAGWIKEKRLSVGDYPNLTYPCNSCGDAIQHHHLCFPCSSRLSRDIRQLKAKEEKNAGQGIGYHYFRPRK